MYFTAEEKHLIWGLFHSLEKSLRDPEQGKVRQAQSFERIQNDQPLPEDFLHVQEACAHLLRGLKQMEKAKTLPKEQIPGTKRARVLLTQLSEHAGQMLKEASEAQSASTES